MGFLWDIVQQVQLSSQSSRAESLEQRVEELEQRLEATIDAFTTLVKLLEAKFGEDLDGDGRIG